MWFAVVVWFAACGGRTVPLDDDTEGFDVGGQQSVGGTSGRAGSGGQAGWWSPTGGTWPWYGGYPNVGGWRTGGGPGYGGFGASPTGGRPGYGGYPDGGPPPTDGGIPWDALPLADGGPVADCVICVRDHCRDQVDACAANTACRRGILCALLQCQPTQYDCMFACFGDDYGALTAAINVATCLPQCGSDCVAVFGALG
jgi:hypothetical protein